MRRGLSISGIFILMTALSFSVNCTDEADPLGTGDVSNTNFTATRQFSFEVDITDQTGLDLSGISGDVSITGMPGTSSVIVSGTREVGSESLEDAEAHLADLEVSVSDIGSEIVVKTIQPAETYSRSYIVNYDIEVPNDLEVSASNINGTMSIASTDAAVSAQVTNGLITLDEIEGDVSVQLINGQIDASITLPLDGTLGMSIVNGNIALDIPQTTSALFSATVTNGIITISNLTIHNQSSTASSVSGTLGDGRGTIGLSTVNGNINVTGN